MAAQPIMLERPFSRPSLRQRSSTMTSLTSSHKSPTTSFNSAKSPDQISQETSFDHVPSWERPESAAKTLLSRGSRILKRQGSKFNLASTVPPNGDVSSDRQRKAVEIRELLHRAPKGRSKSATTKHEALKQSISAPFGFQHVTHTHPAHFKALERVSNNELITEFTAIRAAQRPKTELKGIHADNLQFQNIIADEPLDTDRPVTSSGIVSDTPMTPPHRPGLKQSKTSPGLALRQSRSIENFSRPMPRSPTSPVTPPTRRSSRNACPTSIIPDTSTVTVEAILGVNAQQIAALPSPISRDIPSKSYVDTVAVGHAVTTLDDSIQMLRSITFAGPTSSLAEVPEEEELYRLDETTGTPPQARTRASLRRSQSFPSIRASTDFSRADGEYTDEFSASFETLDSQQLRKSDSRSSDHRRISIGFKEIDINGWEEDIDYCYEHAAEADCDFDWWETSAVDEDHLARERQMADLERAQTFQRQQLGEHRISAVPDQVNRQVISKPLRPAQLVASQLGVPELDPPSAKSAASLPDALTPNSVSEETVSYEMVSPKYPVTNMTSCSSAFLPKEDISPVDEETMYEAMLSSHDSVNDYTFISSHHNRGSPAESRRSSRTPLSKCDSQESMFPSRAASIQQKHRSSNSCASLPDLVHSMTSSRETINAGPVDLTDPNAVPLYRSLSHKRTQSLATSTLKKVASEHSFAQVDAPPPLGVLEEVSPISEESTLRSSFDMSRGAGPTFATRMRSASSAIRGAGRASKATYSLYPSSVTMMAGPGRL